MLLKAALLFLALVSVNVSAAQREKNLLSLINTEIGAIEKVNKKGEQLNYRLFELYIEKTKILRRAENEALLKDQAAGKPVNKTQYFLNSENSFNMTQEFGLKKIKHFANGRYLAAFYYGLASHQIEIQNNIERDQAKIINWLNMALSKSNTDEKKYMAQVKLAEVYYSLKEYEKSIKNYLPVINNKEDRWYTKNLYNLSWCYFQTKNYDKSVSLALKAFHASSNKRYEDVSFVTMDALDYFYVFLKKPENGIQFHIKYNTNPTNRMEHLLKLITLSKKFISSDVALQTERPARTFCKEVSDYLCLLNLSAIKLDIYREKKDYQQHYALTKEALKEYIVVKSKKMIVEEEVLNGLINNLAETASTYQQLVYKSYYVFNNNAEETYKTIVDYYQVLKEFNPISHHEYAFLQGELSFKEKKYEFAGGFYFESLAKIKMNKTIPQEFVDKLFKSMMALANEPQFSNKNFFEKAHVAYLDYYDKKPNAIPVYEALFKFYQSESKWSSSENLLVKFNTSMPSEAAIQKEMMKVVLNNITQLKDSNRLNFWIVKLKSGFLSFEKAFIDQNVKILAQLLFESAQQKENKQDYAGAVLDYQKIVNNKEYPDEIRADSMYNISINYLKQKDAALSYTWLKDSIRLKTNEAVVKKVSDIEAIAHEYVVIQALPQASALFKYLLKNHCTTLKQPDTVLLVFSQLEIAQNKPESFTDIPKLSPCTYKTDTLAFTRSLYIDWLWQKRSYLSLGNLGKNIHFKPHWDGIFHSFYSNFWRFTEEDKKNTEFALFHEQMKKFYTLTKDALSNQSHIEYSAIDSWSQENNALIAFSNKIKRKGSQQGDLKYLQKNLEDELQDLAQTKESKLKLAESLKDSNLYQAQLYALIVRFDKTREWLDLWNCTSKVKDEKKQWLEVQKQVIQGLQEQVTSFKDVISTVMSKGALPLSSIQEVRGDRKFDNFFYENKKESSYFIMHRTIATSPGGDT